MAPGILQGQKKSLASDVYAFGIIMWEFSASELTFYEWDHLSLIHNICEGFDQRFLKECLLYVRHLCKDAGMLIHRKDPVVRRYST